MLKYQMIAEEIDHYIERENLKHGDRLPSVRDLMAIFKASKSTIISALELLNKSGIIYQIRGSGIFVRKIDRTGFINLSTRRGFTKELSDFEINNVIVKNELINPDDNLKHHLEITNDQTKVQYVNRVTYIDSLILAVEHSYYNNDFIPWMSDDIVSKSIFNHIINDLNIRINYSNKFFRILKLDKENARLMQQNVGDPALYFEEYFFMNDGLPFDYSNLYYNHEVAQFFMFTDNNIPN